MYVSIKKTNLVTCDHVLSLTKKKENKREMRDATSVVAPAFPILATVALAVILVAAAALCRGSPLSLPRCPCSCHHRHCRPHHRRPIAAISRCRRRIALVLPRLPRYRPHSCHHSVAPDLAAVVAAALPPPWPLLPSLQPPLLPCNPHPCHGCRRCDTALSPPRCPRSSCCCPPPCSSSPLPSHPCPPLPSCPRPRALTPLSGLCLCHPRPSSPPSTTTAIAPIDDHHQFFRTVDDNIHQNPLDLVSHQGRQ